MKKNYCQIFLKMLQMLIKFSRLGVQTTFLNNKAILPGFSTGNMKRVAPRFNSSFPSIFLLLSLLIGFPGFSWAGQATLQWNQNSEADLAGYKVYYGTAVS